MSLFDHFFGFSFFFLLFFCGVIMHKTEYFLSMRFWAYCIIELSETKGSDLSKAGKGFENVGIGITNPFTLLCPKCHLWQVPFMLVQRFSSLFVQSVYSCHFTDLVWFGQVCLSPSIEWTMKTIRLYQLVDLGPCEVSNFDPSAHVPKVVNGLGLVLVHVLSRTEFNYQSGQKHTCSNS